MAAGRLNVHCVIGGRYHDFDFARLEILKLLHPHEQLRVSVAGDYADTRALAAADALITYTCDLRPGEAEQDALIGYVEHGGRWLALHGTNSLELGTVMAVISGMAKLSFVLNLVDKEGYCPFGRA